MSYRIPIRFTEIEAAERILQKMYDQTMKALNPTWWDLLLGNAVIPLTDERKALRLRLEQIEKALVALDEMVMHNAPLIERSVDPDFLGQVV